MGIGRIKILAESPFCSFQGNYRYQYLNYGFPSSGPLDSVSMRGANYLVGNQQWETCLELMIAGPKLAFYDSATIAIVGASLEVFINDELCPCMEVIRVSPGDQLHFGKFKSGFVSYLAIVGGFHVTEFLGSRSSLVHLNFGEQLIAGSEIGFSLLNRPVHTNGLPNFMRINQPEVLTLRTLNGVDCSNEEQVSDLYNQEFEVSPKSNRMGVRLHSEVPINLNKTEIISSGVLKGTVQLPASGQPIIMTSDHQTAGGYPRIASVITHDLDYLAQMPPNSKIRFRKVALEKAVDLLQIREQKISILFD